MKLSKLFCAIPLATLPLSFAAISCGSNKNKEESYTQQILDEFMGNEKKGIAGIASIPRPSGHCLAIQQYVHDIVTECLPEDAEVIPDIYNNVYYTIPATEGCENWKPIALQAHMDMVVDGMPEEETLVHRVYPVIEGDLMHSKDYKTSIGADDGIGLAMVLWITKNYKTFKHGLIRVICTADEEIGSLGAHNISEKCLMYGEEGQEKTIDYLVNLDEENRWGVARSCTGTLMEKYYNSYTPVESTFGQSFLTDIYIANLKGGHSAFDILNQRANADRLIFEFLDYLVNVKNVDIQLVSYDHKRYEETDDIVWKANQLIENGHVQFVCDKGVNGGILDEYGAEFLNIVFPTKYTGEERSKLAFKIEQTDSPEEYDPLTTPMMSLDETNDIIQMVAGNQGDVLCSNDPFDQIYTTGFPYGYSEKNENDVPKASVNIGPFSIKYNKKDAVIDFEVDTCLRSSVYEEEGQDSPKYSIGWLKNQYHTYAKTLGFSEEDETIEIVNEFQPWVYDGTNDLVNFVVNSYKELGCEAKIIDPPAYLEVAEWINKKPELPDQKAPTCASIGVQLDDVHTKNETLHIDTIENCFKVLLNCIAWMEKA